MMVTYQCTTYESIDARSSKRCPMVNVSKRIAIAAQSVAVFDGTTMRKLLLAVAAVTSVVFTLATTSVAQTVPNVPIAVICYAQQEKEWRVGYLYRVIENGDAMYLSPTGKLGTTINAKGVVVAPTNRPAALDCYGKTLDELRSIGRVMEFQRAK
jgi:hypothetical protein